MKKPQEKQQFAVDKLRVCIQVLEPHSNDFAEHFFQSLSTDFPDYLSYFLEGNQIRPWVLQLVAAIGKDLSSPKVILRECRQPLQEAQKTLNLDICALRAASHTLLRSLRFFFKENWTSEAEVQLQILTDVLCSMMNTVKAEAVEVEKSEPAGLEDLARNLSRRIFEKTLLQTTDEFEALAENKAKSLLQRALRQEARAIMDKLSPPAKPTSTESNFKKIRSSKKTA